MNTVRKHLDKIRSDAAECVLLSKLVADGKGAVFVRTAEHLNSLAIELEKTLATNSANTGMHEERLHAARPEDHEEAVAINTAGATRHQPASRPSRMLKLLLVIVLGGIVGASFKPAKEYWSLYASQSKYLALESQDQTTQTIAALLSSEHAERHMLVERLSALANRLDNLATALENSKTARAEVAGRSNKDSGSSEEKSPDLEARPPVHEEKSASEENPSSASGSSAKAKQSDSLLPDPVDRVGAIPVAPKPSELDLRKSAVGPRGCTQFRSFDPVSGTYTTLDGRRRPCQQ
jgi:hypothetical protein